MENELIAPNPWMILPFGLLLAAIALMPLLAADWWVKHYSKVAIALGVVPVAYYVLVLKTTAMLQHAAVDYIGFIALIGSLFVVSGGIHISVKGESTPLGNVLFLLFGAIIANLLGTTGASMLLIRPWIRMNKYRVTAHHIIFFIFIVSNIGGCLTPIGDPPLLLGYFRGIPFFWVVEHCWPMWLVGMGMMLAMFYVVDLLNFRRAPKPVREKETAVEVWRVEGLPNLFFLAVILGAVFIKQPLFLREGIMLAAAAGSYFTTKKHIHEANHFNFHPIQEVAILFIGIFATMMPALDWLELNASKVMGSAPQAGFFYWSTGTLSSVLDNAPTYLAFLSAVFGTFINQDVVTQVQHLIQTGGADLATFVHGEHAEAIKNTFLALQKYHGDHVLAKNVNPEEIGICFLLGNVAFNKYILAISVGAVFFGACTYIGNGPNFMVKAIANQQKIRTPAFMGYIFKYALPFMLPMLFVVWLIFFR